MRRPVFSTAFEALGYTPALERLYWQVLGLSGEQPGKVGTALLRTPAQLRKDLAPLIEHGIVTIDADRLEVAPPAAALALLLDTQARAALDISRRLTDLARAMPHVAASPAPARGGEPLEGEIVVGPDAPEHFVEWIASTTGDLLWLRPDQWRMAHEPVLVKAVAAAVAGGRRSRSIYPVRALTEAPEVLVARAEAGEQIRVVAEVPSRLMILGSGLALLPENLGFSVDRRLIVRQPGLVRALTSLFEQLWDRAAAVPDLDRGAARPDLRRVLLEQLAEGSKDEQIARTMGTSLRTVRRRIAELLIELGVDSRFQAGVEAVRRGWV